MLPSPSPLARPVGYVLVLAALFFAAVGAAFLAREFFGAPRTVRVHFTEIATLSEGDAVVERGVPVGVVRDIRIDSLPRGGRDAVATLELFHHRFLARDTRFVNFSHSLMGARKVWVEPGVSREPLDESVLQEGVFAPGLAETLHRADSLVSLVARLRAETERLLTGDHGVLRPLLAAHALDSAAQTLGDLSARLETAQRGLRSGLTGFSSAASKTGRSLRAAEPALDNSWKHLRELVATVESVRARLDTVLTRTEKIAAMAADTAGLGAWLTRDDVYAQLEKSVRVLEATARVLEKDGLTDSMKIRPRVRNRN